MSQTFNESNSNFPRYDINISSGQLFEAKFNRWKGSLKSYSLPITFWTHHGVRATPGPRAKYWA